MKQPVKQVQILELGHGALLAIAARLRDDAARNPDAPELWLAIRDIESLAGRIFLDEDFWALGRLNSMFGGQDYGVLDELIARDASVPLTRHFRVTELEAAHLRDLRRLLTTYEAAAFD